MRIKALIVIINFSFLQLALSQSMQFDEWGAISEVRFFSGSSSFMPYYRISPTGDHYYRNGNDDLYYISTDEGHNWESFAAPDSINGIPFYDRDFYFFSDGALVTYSSLRVNSDWVFDFAIYENNTWKRVLSAPIKGSSDTRFQILDDAILVTDDKTITLFKDKGRAGPITYEHESRINSSYFVSGKEEFVFSSFQEVLVFDYNLNLITEPDSRIIHITEEGHWIKLNEDKSSFLLSKDKGANYNLLAPYSFVYPEKYIENNGFLYYGRNRINLSTGAYIKLDFPYDPLAEANGQIIANRETSMIIYEDDLLESYRLYIPEIEGLSMDAYATFGKFRSDKNGHYYFLETDFIYRSDDEAKSWERILTDEAFWTVTDYDIAPNGDIYFISNNKLYKSDTDGQNLEILNHSISSLQVIYVNENVLLSDTIVPNVADNLTGQNEVYEFTQFRGSLDNGKTWPKEMFNINYVPGGTLEQNGYNFNISADPKNYSIQGDIMFFHSGTTTYSKINRNNLSRQVFTLPISLTTSGSYTYPTTAGELVYHTTSPTPSNSFLIDNQNQYSSLGIVPGGNAFEGQDPQSTFLYKNKRNNSSPAEFYYRKGFYGEFQNIYLISDLPEIPYEYNFDNRIERTATGDYILYDRNRNFYRVHDYQEWNNCLSGNVYADKEMDCNYDGNEAKVNNSLIKFESSTRTIEAIIADGFYEVKLPDGAYTITVQNSNDDWVACNNGAMIDFINGDDNQTLDIGMQAEDYCPKIEAEFTSIILRRCFDSRYNLSIRNTGTEESNNTKAVITIDPFFESLRSNYTLNKISDFDYEVELGTLAHGESKTIRLDFVVSCDATLGQTHCIMATVTNDDDCTMATAETAAARYLENRGSYDPNDLRVFNVQGYEDEYFDKDEYVIFQTRFQNTGTDTAFTVLIKQKLSEYLDENTLEILESTHGYSYTKYGDKTMAFKFDNILLPDSTTNLLGSMGSITYRAKVKTDTEYGTSFSTFADIFFDFNDPIRTNDEIVHVVKPCGVDPVTEEITVEICGFEYYDGHYNTGRYRDMFLTEDGCDSIRFVNLVKHPRYYDPNINATICDGESFRGYTEAGFYRDTLTSIYGCDSIIPILLKVDPSYIDTVSYESRCAGAHQDGYTEPGTYLIELSNTSTTLGCPVIDYKELTIHPHYEKAEEITLCAGQDYMGITEEGTTVLELQSITGCDSIVSVTLTFEDPINEIFSISICEGGSFMGYTEPGIYQIVDSTAEGCDSIFTLQLQVLSSPQIRIQTTICEGDSVLGYTETGIYVIEEMQDSCITRSELDLTVLPIIITEIDTTICEGEDYLGYITTGNYIVEEMTSAACIEQEINLTVLSINDLDCLVSTDEVSEDNSLLLYPNPVYETLIVEMKEVLTEEAELSIHSMGGQLILSKTISDKLTNIETESIAAGTYLLYVKTEERFYVEKFVKL